MGIEKRGSGYKNVSPKTGKTFSKKPLSKEKAREQQKAIYANKKGK